MPSSLFKAVPIDALVWLRIAIGLLGGSDILGSGIYYHWYLRSFDGFTFRYFGFEWVHPLPEPFLSLFFVVGFLLGIAVALGWRFKLTAPLFALAFLYMFLLEKAHYLNHGYFFCWLAALLALTPAWREFSLDVKRQPQEWSPVAPRWALLMFPTMMGIVYFYGGIAKLNTDWLLHAQPLQQWLQYKANKPLIGPLLALPETAYFMAWGGFLLDSSIAFLLLHKRLRWWALAGAVFFHATNHLIFNIGIFPYLSLVLTSLFFEPYWPRNFVNWLANRFDRVKRWQKGWQKTVKDARAHQAFISSPTKGPSPNHAYTHHHPFWGELPNYPEEIATEQRKKWIKVGLLSLLCIHLLLPFRHHFFASNVAWSEEGHRYSWRMMLRSKTGSGDFKVLVYKAGSHSTEADSSYTITTKNLLTKQQHRKLYTHPDMILQFAKHLAAECERQGDSCAVYANTKVRLNQGAYQTYIDPKRNLAKLHWSWLGSHDWVLPERKD